MRLFRGCPPGTSRGSSGWVFVDLYRYSAAVSVSPRMMREEGAW